MNGRELLSNVHLSVPLFGPPTRHRIERGRSERLACAQTETGVMPGATNRIVQDEALGERRSVVSADAADREHLIATACEQHGLATDVPGEHVTVLQLRRIDALLEVGPFCLFCTGAHWDPSPSRNRRSIRAAHGGGWLARRRRVGRQRAASA
jgi:hypothetical protein